MNLNRAPEHLTAVLQNTNTAAGWMRPEIVLNRPGCPVFSETAAVPAPTRTRVPVKRRCERGQAMTEYLFLVVLCGLVCIPVVRWLPNAVRGYIRPFYYCISRPIP